jgi:hypothetical protein
MLQNLVYIKMMSGKSNGMKKLIWMLRQFKTDSKRRDEGLFEVDHFEDDGCIF